MPLPAALLKKLTNRGIVSVQQLPPPAPEKEKVPLLVPFCPNTFNVYHECSAWCQTHWKGFASPEPRYAKNMKICIAKYPLPPKWVEVFDKGIGRYYYWNTDTDMVCWLPPKHPKAVISESAAKLRTRMLNALSGNTAPALHGASAPHADEDGASAHAHKDRDKDSRHSSDRRRIIHKNWHKYDDRKGASSHHRKRSRRDDLDPMDPAAYSDIPRGTWSDGLEVSKGRADSTASGALFQQRPYPAPGEVLAANKHNK